MACLWTDYTQRMWANCAEIAKSLWVVRMFGLLAIDTCVCFPAIAKICTAIFLNNFLDKYC